MSRARVVALAWLALAATSGISGAAPGGRAVIVGVGQYADPELPDLEGPPHDARAMRALLIDRFGFPPAQITLLVDGQATREAILRALAEMAWRVGRDEPAVFYFSGHGARVFDASGDEPDGWDEGLVPHDSGRSGRPNLDLLDDELHAVLRWLSLRGAATTYIYDSCHAGTGARDPLARVAPRDARPRLITARPQAAGIALDDGPDGWTLIAAAREDQLAFEKPLGPGGARRGLFTWMLIEALRTAPPGASLRDVFEPMRAAVQARDRRQDPQLEGPGADRTPFGARLRPPPTYTPVEPGEGGAILGAGEAHGVRPGAVYAIAAPGARRAADAAFRATVTAVDATTARLALPPGATVAPASRAFLVKPAAPAEAIPIHLATDDPLDDALRARLTQPGVRVVTEPSAGRLTVRHRAGRASIEAPDGRPIDAWHTSADGIGVIAAGMTSRIMAWVRWHAIAGLSSGDDTLTVDLTATVDGADHRGAVEVAPGRELTLTVANTGPVDLYLTVLALAPDGAVSVVYPLPGSRAFVQAFGRWQQRVEAALPVGVERTVDRLMLIATTAPADFRILQQGPAALAGGARGLGPLDGLGALWPSAGARARGAGAERWTTRSLEIVTAR